jgi:uncharacterized protein YdaU (DUF1376 family)
MNYYPFHIGDYLSATRHLSWEEDAAYRRLLDTYYTNEKPLPGDLRAVCRLVLATTESQREAVRVVLEEFFRKTDEGWINTRADAEIEAMRSKQQKQREKANKRWAKPETEHGNASAMPQHHEIDAAASNAHADAMPPTPTPTPTPTPIEKTVDASQPAPAAVAAPKAPPVTRGVRLPKEWKLPAQWGRWALESMPGWTEETARAEAEKFHDYWVSQPGQKGVKSDWQATWRNWCRNVRTPSAGFRPPANDIFAGAL